MRILRRWWFVGVALAVPLAVLGILRAATSLDVQWASPLGHVIVMAVVASLALAVAAVAMRAALECREPAVVWLSVGCTNVGLLLLGHGLTTPGALGQPVNQWVGRLPYGAMASIAVCLFVASWTPGRRIDRWVGWHPVATLLMFTVPPLLLVAIVSHDPLALGGGTPFPHEVGVFRAVSVSVIALLLVVIRRHWQRWQLGHDLVQAAIVLSSISCIAAVASFELGRFTRLSWWNYHGYLLAGFGGTVYAIVRRTRQHRTAATVLASAFADDPFAHIVEGYPQALRVLVREVEIKDAYTHGHSERTARVAVELGVRMALDADQLRVIARGAYLHDLGKIAIADEILNKPGALDRDERRAMEEHPRLGYEMASSAASLREVLPVILHHHERVDGGGYPEGLRGRSIPIEARVVAVADVWDALTSDRAYRIGWEPDRALAHIVAGRSSHFDPFVVDAFVALASDWGIHLPSEPGEAAAAWDAGQTCHEIDRSGDLVDA